MHILVVDDNPDSRDLLRLTLTAAGHRVTLARDGLEGLELARAQVPDCIVSDIFMPRLDGFKLCYEVKHDPRLRQVPVVFYTATYVDREDEKLALGLGASRFIVKPVDNQVFLAELEAVLAEAQRGKLAVPAGLTEEPATVFRQYDQALSRKLEAKSRTLELYMRLFEHALDGIAILNRHGEIVRQNPAHRSLLGYDDQVLRALGAGAYLDPTALARLNSALADGEAVAGEGTARDAAGRRLAVFYSVFPIATGNGDHGGEVLSGAVLQLHDLTGQKEAEAAAARARAEWEKTFDAVSDVVLVLDNKLTVRRANRAAGHLFGEEPAALTGKRCYQLFEHGEAPCAGCPATGKTPAPQTVEIHHQGVNRTFLATVVPLPAAAGEEPGYVLFAKDISQRKSLEEQLRQAQKLEAIGQLAGGVAHDFNNLLTAIHGYQELAAMKLATDPAAAAADLEEAQKAAKRAGRLVSQLLLFSRRKPQEKRPLSVNRAIEELAKMLRRMVGEGVVLELELAPTCPQVEADPGSLDQVVMNLVVNARDAMAGGGTVRITTARVTVDETEAAAWPEAHPGDFVSITVADTGCGIAPENLPHIFEPFYTTKEEGKGTGLGLAVVYGIVTAHHGFITVHSEQGRGTTFRVFLPALAQRHGEGGTAEKDEPVPMGRGETVLVVEDDPAIASLVRHTLEGHGYRVRTAGTAAAALELLETGEGPCDLLLADIVLPGEMHGLECAHRARQRLPGLPVVITSGYADQQHHWPLLEERGYPFLEKPFSLADLLRLVRQVLDRRETGGEGKR